MSERDKGRDLRNRAAGARKDGIRAVKVMARRAPSYVPRPVSRATMHNVHVVPHTHWDREWYMTFASHRAKLIELVDGLMDILERNPDYKNFMFDGQVAPVDDYLATLPAAIRPRQEKRLRKLIKDGRIDIGPWYTLADQYLMSGETTLRNLEYGIKRAKEFGGVMDIAYCPDQFGLIPELPKILTYVGLRRGLGLRGMRRSMPDRFIWRASDGSSVEMLNLKEGYFHRKHGAETMRQLARRAKGKAILLMGGFDHAVPDESIVNSAKKSGAQMSSLPRFYDALGPLVDPYEYTGEIRDVGDHNLLPNVVSNRNDLRLAIAEAERAVQRAAEVIAAFCYDDYPTTLLDECWRNLFWIATHDSSPATGIDEVTRENLVRCRYVRDTAEGIAEHGLKVLGGRMQERGDYVWNPSNFERDFVIDGKVAKCVPPLGWAKLERRWHGLDKAGSPAPSVRFLDEPELGDTYTFDPGGPATPLSLPVETERRPGEPFTRLRVSWENTQKDHRTRILIKLPEPVAGSVADTPFGDVARPNVPAEIRGRDTHCGYPAAQFIVAGGLAVLVDRVAEYEILPETNELAITLLRAHGHLSVPNPSTRIGGAGPRLETFDTQMLQPITWNFAVMPWTDAHRAPVKEWEQFMLPGRTFTSPGGGSLPEKGTYFRDLPEGNLSAVLPEGVRTFTEDPTHRIVTAPLRLQAPSVERRGIGSRFAFGR